MVPPIRLAFRMRVLPCNAHEMLSCIPERLPCIHRNRKKPNSVGRGGEGAQEKCHGARGRSLRKAVPRHGREGGGVILRQVRDDQQ